MLVRGVMLGGLLRMPPSELANHFSDGHIARFFIRREVLDLMKDFLHQAMLREARKVS